jgi:hypothetical protein
MTNEEICMSFFTVMLAFIGLLKAAHDLAISVKNGDWLDKKEDDE